MPVSAKKYKVSVRLMTYNHQLYIGDAIESILSQKTDFLVEVVIGDDFSTDGTLEVIKKYNDTGNVHLKVLKRNKGDDYWHTRQRLGRLYNFTDIISNCSGEYIALLDGDDYWNDPRKLQKQVDILDNHPEYVACHHWQKIRHEKENGEYEISDATKIGHGYFPNEISTVKEIFENKVRIKTRTVLFRNVLNDFPEWFYKVPFGDVPLSFLLGQHGKFYFIDEEMAIYRQTGKGVSSYGRVDTDPGKWFEKRFYEWIKIWDYANLHYAYKFNKESVSTINYFYKQIIEKNKLRYLAIVRCMYHSTFKRKVKLSSRLDNAYFLIKFLKWRIGKSFYHRLVVKLSSGNVKNEKSGMLL